ncbi:MAG: COG1470 family protein [Rubripirellula sp.]
MTGHVFGGILRVASRIANTTASLRRGRMTCSLWLLTAFGVAFLPIAAGQQPELPLTLDPSLRQSSMFGQAELLPPASNRGESNSRGSEDVRHAGKSPRESERSNSTDLESFRWYFGRSGDENFDAWPDNWQRYRGRGYPTYVEIGIVPKNVVQAEQFQRLDTTLIRWWQKLRRRYPDLPLLPPSISDAVVDRYLRVQLDGGQAKIQSPSVSTDRMYQYRFSCQMMTEGLRHDTARAELVFLTKDDQEIVAHSTPALSGTNPWQEVSMDLVRPPADAVKMVARLLVDRAEDGLEDIRGAVGFDDIRIEQHPQLQITTDSIRGVYRQGEAVQAKATIRGVPTRVTRVNFELLDHDGRLVTSKSMAVQPTGRNQASSDGQSIVDSELKWDLPTLGPGFYRLTASLHDSSESTLRTETTFAVLSELIGNTPHGVFGWTMPEGNQGMSPRDFANWLASLGVAWVKYPCWLPPEDTEKAEELAAILSKLQDVNVHTVGMLDHPPEGQLPLFSLRGRRDLVAAQLFRDPATWQPLLEPVMTRLTLKVRTWQLGGDRDYSFLGRPRLREAIREISTGLQGYGQPIDVAISWPWLERELPTGESSWQAVCRSSDPPLEPRELDASLTLSERESRNDGPRTWLLTDPIEEGKYDRNTRVRDLVLRMATVRSHRVQAAFVSNPQHPDRGLLRADGRPDDLLLPWRTTSRLIGNLRKVGSLKLRGDAQNSVFVGAERSVVMLWSEGPSEERVYFGDGVKMVDVWGNVTSLPVEYDGDQPVQRVPVGRVPVFIIGADPTLLAFRMSVELEQKQLDSLLGQVQNLSVVFTNPTRESLVGQMRLKPPETWSLESSTRAWEALAGRSSYQDFEVVLSNTAKIGVYEVPIQFELETIPPKLITVYRKVNVGPEGLEMSVVTRLLPSGDLRVRIVIVNRGTRTQSYDCMLFPPPGRQYKRRFLTIPPWDSVSREIYWPNGNQLIGQQMLLRAVEQDGRRVLNYAVDISR